MKPLIGFIVGVGVTYLFGAMIGDSFDPSDWHWVLRLLVTTFATFWGLVGIVVGFIMAISDEDEDDD